jgi:hypothetical protein
VGPPVTPPTAREIDLLHRTCLDDVSVGVALTFSYADRTLN